MVKIIMKTLTSIFLQAGVKLYLRAIVCKIQANGESDHLGIVFFFIYVRDFHERKLTKNIFSKISFYTHFTGM